MLTQMEEYIVVRGLSPRAAKNYRIAAQDAVEAGIRTPADLTPYSVGQLVASLRDKNLSTATIANKRAMVCCLWRWAVEAGYASGPVRVPPVRVRLPPVRAWTAEDLSRLLAAVKSERGPVYGWESSGRQRRRESLPMPTIMQAVVLLGYESGLRHGDLHSLMVRDFSPDFRTLHRVAHKTGETVTRSLSEACAAAVRAVAAISVDGSLFSGHCAQRTIARHMSRCVARAGLSEGSIKWLRRAGATACERTSPGSSQAYCAHRTPGLALRHYVDWSQVRIQPTPPPFLDLHEPVAAAAADQNGAGGVG